MASLDLCNRCLSEEYPARLKEAVRRLEALGKTLSDQGWQTEPSDPLRLTLRAPAGLTGLELADRLRRGGAECEYADRDFLVLMTTPENGPEDLARVSAALGENRAPAAPAGFPPPARGERVLSVREALFAPQETVPAEESLGRICGAPTVSCPPAVPIAVSGERIGREAAALFSYYGVQLVDILKE